MAGGACKKGQGSGDEDGVPPLILVATASRLGTSPPGSLGKCSRDLKGLASGVEVFVLSQNVYSEIQQSCSYPSMFWMGRSS